MILFAAATGCVLCFEQPLDHWLNPELFRPHVKGSLPSVLAVEALEAHRSDLIATAYSLEATEKINLLVDVEPRHGGSTLGFDQVFLDGGDGRIDGYRQLGPGWDRAHLMRGVYLAHFTLLASDPGRWLMGVAASAWFLANLIGLYLAWPKGGLVWRAWVKAATVSWRAKPPRVWLDLHRTIGLWLLAPLCVLAFTSAGMNFFTEALAPAVSVLSPPRPSPFDEPPRSQVGPRLVGWRAVLDAAVARAAGERPGWRAALFQYDPARNLFGVRFTWAGRESYRGLGPVTYWFDGAYGQLVYLDDPYHDSAGQRLIRALYPLHTGQMLGTPGVAADFGLGIATVVLSVAGVYLWVKRRPGRTASRNALRAG